MDDRTQGAGPTEATADASVNEDETSAAQVPPRLKFPDDLGTAEAEFVQTISTVLWPVVQVLLEERGLTAPALTVLVTDDIMGCADREGLRIGIGPDRRSGIERVGGVVTGKTLISNDSTEAVVLLNKDSVASGDGYARLQTATGLAHEFSHILYGAVRSTTVGNSPDRWLPWDIAELLACGAAEEYRCDRLVLLVDQVITATDDRGERITLATAIGGPYISGIAAALDAVSPGLEDTILRYRMRRMPLQQMWNEVARVTEEVLLYLAHAEAYSDLDGSLLDTIEHKGASLLMPIIAPLFQYLRATPILPENTEWAEDRATLKRIGRDCLMAMWRQLGLHPRPQAEGFYLEVTDPAF